MEFHTKYTQPFTLAEATLLDVSTISEEITRLQYSLKRLQETQEILQETIQETPSSEEVDAEILLAFKENQQVIGSQEERITILKLALADKGVNFGPHYSLDTSGTDSQQSSQPAPQIQNDPVEEGDEGLYL